MVQIESVFFLEVVPRVLVQLKLLMHSEMKKVIYHPIMILCTRITSPHY